MSIDRVLVTGATGYVGSRLVPELLDRGYTVRVTSRSTEKLERWWWADREGTELFQANALDYDAVREACKECDAVYYLIHSMGQGSGDFEEADRKAAQNMARAAETEGLQRIIYLGGIKPTDDELPRSKHRRSRIEVEDALSSGSVPLTTFRAAMVVGSGSASFEMLRYSLERLPSIFVTHSYVDDSTQPISISNVLEYLVNCLVTEETIGETFDIGGPEVLTNRRIMQIYCQVNNLPEPRILSTKLIPIQLVSLSTNFLTPLPYDLIDPLVKGAQEPSACTENRIREIISQELMPIREAIERASKKTLREVRSEDVDPNSSPAEWPRDGDPEWSGGTHYEDRRSRDIESPLEDVWRVLLETGSRNGLFFAPWFRNFVGFIDKYLNIFEFPDRQPVDLESVSLGDHLDCWIVSEMEKPKRLKLRADVRLPGDATYEFRLEENNSSETRLIQIARFRPRGIWGRIYWRILAMFHVFSFPLTIRSIQKKSVDYSNQKAFCDQD